MKSFENVYKTSKQRKLNEQQQAFAADRARLIAVMKKEYGISDFNKLSESEKANYKSLINEMWSNESGLNEKGLNFITEGTLVLNQNSTDAQIEKKFRKEIVADIDNIIACLVSKGSCNKIVDIKKDIEKSIGKRIPVSNVKKWLAEELVRYMGVLVRKSMKANESLNEGLFGSKWVNNIPTDVWRKFNEECEKEQSGVKDTAKASISMRKGDKGSFIVVTFPLSSNVNHLNYSVDSVAKKCGLTLKDHESNDRYAKRFYGIKK